MQGISQNKVAVRYFIYGIIAKVVSQFPMVFFFKEFGPLISSAIGFMVVNGLIINSLDRQFKIRSDKMLNQINWIVLFSLVTYLVALTSVYAGNMIIRIFANPYTSIGSLFVVLVSTVLGGLVYVYLALKSRIADTVIGSKATSIRNKLNIK